MIEEQLEFDFSGMGYEDKLRQRNKELSERMLKHFACSCSLAMILDVIRHGSWVLKMHDPLIQQAVRRLEEVAKLENDPFFTSFKNARGE